MNANVKMITIDDDPRKSLVLAMVLSGTNPTVVIDKMRDMVLSGTNPTVVIDKMRDMVLSGVGEICLVDLPFWINTLESIADALKNGLSESGHHTYDLLRQKSRTVTTIVHERRDSKT